MGRDEYDAIVVGAGPAGSAAAIALARAGIRVLLAEKRDTVGSPVRCAEATGPAGEIEQFTPIRPGWITARIEGARIFGPRGAVAAGTFAGAGVMLDREKFDAGLAEEAEARGAEVRVGCEAVGLVTEGEAVRGVRFLEGGKTWSARCRFVLGADGVESVLGRWANLASGWKAAETFSCYEARLRSDKPCDGYLEFYFGREVAPGGYGWAFPKGNGEWNVGVGIEPERAARRPAQLFAEKLFERFDPKCVLLERRGGAAGRSRSLPAVIGNGVALAGDAAHQANPLTGGGIMNALESGDLVGTIAGAALRRREDLAAALRMYEIKWRRMAGKANDRYLKVANILYRYDDDRLEKLVRTAAKLFEHRRGGGGPFRFAAGLLHIPVPLLLAILPLIHRNRGTIF